MHLRTRVKKFINEVFETKDTIEVNGIIVPKHKNILIVRENEKGSELIYASNIVTDAGDVYYAQSATAETPTNAFTSLYLSETVWSPSPAKDSDSADLATIIAGTEKAVSATYPKTNDGDSDNTGAGTDVVSWLFSYTQGDFNSLAITAGAISIAAVPAWGSGTTPMLTAFDLSSFAKSASDTLKVFVNHTMNGV